MKKNIYLLICLLLPFTAKAQKEMYPEVSPHDISDKTIQKYKADTTTYYKIVRALEKQPQENKNIDQYTPKEQKIYNYFLENEEALQSPLSTDIWGCSWYCGGGPDSIYASSHLRASSEITYVAQNIHDFDLANAWVPSDKVNSIGQYITFVFRAGSPPVNTFEIYNGYQKSEKAFRDNAKVKKFKMYIDNKPYAVLNLQNTTGCQIFKFKELQGKDHKMEIKLEITEIYPGEKYNDIVISEINFDGTGVHCFAAGSLVLLPDNKSVPIEKLKVGDTVLSLNEQTMQTEKATILSMVNAKHHNLYEFDFGDEKIIATDDHPFLLVDGTFASLVPSGKYNIPTIQLEINDKTVSFKNTTKQETQLLAVKKLDNCEQTYTITRLSRNQVFFINGIAVGIEN